MPLSKMPRRGRKLFDEPGGPNGAGWAPGDSEIALSLFTLWAARTGRPMPSVPISELPAQELEDFWAEDASLWATTDPPGTH